MKRSCNPGGGSFSGFAAVLIWLTPACSALHAQNDSTLREQRPNIVFIMADDLGYGSLGCYGGAQVATPAIDRLAAKGTRLTSYYSNGSVCSPTRAALLTGRYPQRCSWVPDSDLSAIFRAQRKDNPAQRWAWGFSSKEITIAEILQQSGYRTGMTGKWHLGYDRLFHPCNHGFESFRGFMGGAVDYHTHIATHGLRTLDWWDNRELRNEDGYTTDLLTKHAADFITRHKNDPFFLYLPHGAPHTPLQVRDRNSKASKLARYREMIGMLDESVAAVVAAIESNGLREKTMIIFCSDNGPQMTFGTTWRTAGQFDGLKDSLHEGGIRVPCIVSWPGKIPQGAVVNTPVMTMDFFPTIASLGGVAVPADHKIDGTNMLPVLTGADAGPQRALHWESRGKWVVRRGQWKLSDGTRLVDLDTDPAESKNLAAANPALVEELTRLHKNWISRMPAAPAP